MWNSRAKWDRRHFIGGSDARIIMGKDEAALLRLWREKARRSSVDMTSSNAWAEFAAIFTRTNDAHQEHERAKAELKGLVPDEAQQAIGHGVRAKRSKSGAVSFDLLDQGGTRAAL